MRLQVTRTPAPTRPILEPAVFNPCPAHLFLATHSLRHSATASDTPVSPVPPAHTSPVSPIPIPLHNSPNLVLPSPDASRSRSTALTHSRSCALCASSFRPTSSSAPRLPWERHKPAMLLLLVCALCPGVNHLCLSCLATVVSRRACTLARVQPDPTQPNPTANTNSTHEPTQPNRS
jgi:hypothetical protein